MSYMNRMRLARQQALQVDTNANKPDAWVGAVINGTNLIAASQGPAWVWVTINKGGERGNPQQVINRTISPVWNLPVKLGINSQGQPYITDIAESQIDAFASGGSGGSLQSFKVGPHSHEYGMGNYDPVDNRRLVEGKVWWRGSDGPYTVYINSFAYANSSGVDSLFVAQAFDISTYITATIGQHQWIKIGIDPATGLPKALAGTAIAVALPLLPADLAAINFSGFLPLFGVAITAGQSIQGEGDFTDCSYVRVQAASGSVTLTVSDGSTTLTGITEIDFSGATASSGGAGIADVAVSGGSGSPLMAMAFAWFLA